VAPGRRDLERALDRLLAADLAEVDHVLRSVAVGLDRRWRGKLGRGVSAELIREVRQRRDPDDLDPAHQRGLARVDGRHVGASRATLAGDHHHRQDAGRVANRAIE
jgi:hypothetical protein